MARGGKGGGREMPREQRVSRKVSWLLRHGAGSEGLKLGKGGYVGVREALNTNALRSLKVTFPELKEVVASNDKKRFSMILASTQVQSSDPDASAAEGELSTEALQSIPESDDPADYLIRANQGHSLQVDTEGLLTPISVEDGNVPHVVVHGTDEGAWKMILMGGGMRKMGRNHMHFASGLPAGLKSVGSLAAEGGEEGEKEAPPVISGLRKSSTILIFVDIKKALEKGIKWFVSENGVILTEGDEQGKLDYEFFKRVENRKNGRGVLMEGGVLPEGVEVDVEAWQKVVGSKGRGGRGAGGGGRGGKGSGGRGGGKARVNDDSRDVLAGV